MLLLVNNLHEKHIIESQDGQNFSIACASSNLHFVITLHLCYIKNVLAFNQSDAH